MRGFRLCAFLKERFDIMQKSNNIIEEEIGKKDGKFTIEFKEQIRKYINEGLSLAAIARKVGITDTLTSGLRQLYLDTKKEEEQGVIITSMKAKHSGKDFSNNSTSDNIKHEGAIYVEESVKKKDIVKENNTKENKKESKKKTTSSRKKKADIVIKDTDSKIYEKDVVSKKKTTKSKKELPYRNTDIESEINKMKKLSEQTEKPVVIDNVIDDSNFNSVSIDNKLIMSYDEVKETLGTNVNAVKIPDEDHKLELKRTLEQNKKELEEDLDKDEDIPNKVDIEEEIQIELAAIREHENLLLEKAKDVQSGRVLRLIDDLDKMHDSTVLGLQRNNFKLYTAIGDANGVHGYTSYDPDNTKTVSHLKRIINFMESELSFYKNELKKLKK
jgi:transposase-like protein